MKEFTETSTRPATPARGFGTNWFYYYDKPLDAAEAAAQMTASSHAQARYSPRYPPRYSPRYAQMSASSQERPEDTCTAAELRAASLSLRGAVDADAVVLAAQIRSVAEMYTALFAGAPTPPAKQAVICHLAACA